MGFRMAYAVIAVRDYDAKFYMKDYKRGRSRDAFYKSSVGTEFKKVIDALGFEITPSQFIIEKVTKPDPARDVSLADRLAHMNPLMQDYLKNNGLYTKGVHYYRIHMGCGNEFREDWYDKDTFLDDFTLNLQLQCDKILGITFQTLDHKREGELYPMVHHGYMFTEDSGEPNYCPQRYIDIEKGEVLRIEKNTHDEEGFTTEIKHFYVRRCAKKTIGLREIDDFDADDFCWSKMHKQEVRGNLEESAPKSNMFYWNCFRDTDNVTWSNPVRLRP